ncbi:cell cycle control protein [Neolentinus lepideus HHB14362 ss-1]|uniref:Cell cycle control protein n=1 Tax=Neolentinus lepideus HHB14362 ss-1 TaxID=1314782 RepID=A0A165NY26_9AGAM|nr:cell cycle control protein [Neolentinus lepideus HHB14362 ss-1]
MGLFRRRGGSNADNNGEQKKEKGSWRRPANTAFKQQRLKAWQPILTPKTVLPSLFIIGIIFAPIGALLIWGSGLVSEITIDYTDCNNLSAADTLDSATFTDIPSSKFKYSLRSSDHSSPSAPPSYALINNSSSPDPSSQTVCVVRFDVPANLEATVLLYYKLTNFYQNHRRYVKSFDSNQLKGQYVSPHTLNGGDCKPVDTINGVAVYPCGLVANSLFNDTFSNLTMIDSSGNSNGGYIFSEQGIAWPGEAKKYATRPGYNSSQIVPPPNWYKRYPNGYNDSNLPNLHIDEHFQNWMRTAGLPTFSKLYGRNDHDTLTQGTYQIQIGYNFPVQTYHGTKSIVISTVSWVGGKNNFLGWAYVASSALFVFLAIAGTIRHVLKPRRVGDMSLLSWNR